MVKSLYTPRLLRRRGHNKVKSIVSTGCYPVDTMRDAFMQIVWRNPNIFTYSRYLYGGGVSLLEVCC